MFEANHLPPPPAAATLEDAETAEALAAVEAATLEQRTASIRTYKSAASSVNRKASLLQRLHLSYGGGNEEAPAEGPGTPEILPSQTAEAEGKEEQAAAETHAAEGKEQEDKDAGAKDATEEELNQSALSPEGTKVPEAAEARGLVGGAISRRLSKPAETLRRDKEDEEAKSQKPEEATPEVVKEEEEAKEVKHQVGSTTTGDCSSHIAQLFSIRRVYAWVGSCPSVSQVFPGHSTSDLFQFWLVLPLLKTPASVNLTGSHTYPSRL